MKNHYKKLFLFIIHFHGSKNSFKSQHLSWNYVIENIRKLFIHNFNILNDSDDEWDKLHSQVQEYTKRHEMDGFENIIINEMNQKNLQFIIPSIDQKIVNKKYIEKFSNISVFFFIISNPYLGRSLVSLDTLFFYNPVNKGGTMEGKPHRSREKELTCNQEVLGSTNQGGPRATLCSIFYHAASAFLAWCNTTNRGIAKKYTKNLECTEQSNQSHPPSSVQVTSQCGRPFALAG